MKELERGEKMFILGLMRMKKVLKSTLNNSPPLAYLINLFTFNVNDDDFYIRNFLQERFEGREKDRGRRERKREKETITSQY